MAVSVEAAVCNVALLRVGELQLISSLDDDSPQGLACAALWNTSRDATLEAFMWPFATRRAPLAALTNGARGSWSFAYPLPGDCVAPRYIDTGDPAPARDEEVPFTIEFDPTANRVLLCNEDTVALVYTALVDKPALWSPMFRDALAMKLASDLFFSLVKKPQLGFAMLQTFQRYIAMAAASGYNQAKQNVPPESEFILSRG